MDSSPGQNNYIFSQETDPSWGPGQDIWVDERILISQKEKWRAMVCVISSEDRTRATYGRKVTDSL